jgi:hypothetical protein
MGFRQKHSTLLGIGLVFFLTSQAAADDKAPLLQVINPFLLVALAFISVIIFNMLVPLTRSICIFAFSIFIFPSYHCFLSGERLIFSILMSTTQKKYT